MLGEECVVPITRAEALPENTDRADVLVITSEPSVSTYSVLGLADGRSDAGGNVHGMTGSPYIAQMSSRSPIITNAPCGLVRTTMEGNPRSATSLSCLAASRNWFLIGFRTTSRLVVPLT